LEAASCGLPVVATDDGGPRDILQRCQNGRLVDVSDLDALQSAVEESLADSTRWRRWRDNGIEAVSRHYSWDAHVTHYLGEALASAHQAASLRPARWFSQGEVCGTRPPQRLLVLDLDASLASSEPSSLEELRRRLGLEPGLALAVCTGRGYKAARQRYSELHLPDPCLWITQSGTEIHTATTAGDLPDHHWQRHIGRRWDRAAVERAMGELGTRLRRQPEADQGPFKVSYTLEEPDQGIIPLVRQTLRSHGLQARPHLFQHWYLDVLPLTASKTEALRYVALRWKMPLTSILVEASQQGDGELLRGLPLGVVPDDHDPALDVLRSHRRVFFSTRPQAWGLLEGLEHHRFLRR
jgi:sucrose-phosphate synthase